VHGPAIDPDEKRWWLGKTFNDLFGDGFYAGMSICKMPILIIRETTSAKAQHTEFTIRDWPQQVGRGYDLSSPKGT